MPTQAGEPGRPNVLFIAVDDLRPELGCYGNERIQSPNIDALAKRSLVFDRAYCQQAVCNPSRASLMTGLRPDSTKVWDLVTHFRDTVGDVVTLPQHYRRHGYYAVAHGKIYHNPLPDAESWDEPNHWPKQARVWSNLSIERLKTFRAAMRASGKSESAIQRMRAPATDDEDVSDMSRPDGEIADQAIATMRRLSEQGRPFFLAVGFINPHLPFNPPKRYWDLYDPTQLPLAEDALLPRGAPPMAMNTMYELRDYLDFAESLPPDQGPLSEAQQRRLKHGYYAAVSFVDAQVGRLLDELKQLKRLDDTIVVLWGDHGWKLGEHGSWCKQTNYEIDTRAPLILHVPGAESNGRHCQSIVEFVDIYPTLCELADLPLPAHLQGTSLTPLLRDPDADWKNLAFSQFVRRREGVRAMGYSMRTDRGRYVEWLDTSNAKTIAVEWYDHVNDPGENINLANERERKTLLDEQSTTMWKAIGRPTTSDLARPKPVRSSLHFKNERDRVVEVFWLAPDGRRVSQGRIGPGRMLNVNTRYSHRFLIGGGRKQDERIITVSKPEETIVIAKDKPARRSQIERPNILFLMGDDWSWPHAGFLGDRVVKTPTFDRLARRGVVFEHAFVSSPSCTPSRLAIATGQWHWRLGEGANLGGSLAADVPVYPELLEASGYQIGFARKGAEPSKHSDRGSDPFGPRFKSFEKLLENRESGQPFCFWYGAGEPHRPYRAGTGIEQGLEPSEVQVSACLPDNDIVRSDMCDYFESIQRFDRDAERMLQRLEAVGELDNTLVIVSGDNGMPFPRCKATLYDTGTRVPLLVHWPREVAGGRRVLDFVSLTDLAPTILQAAGIDIPRQLTGHSLLSILKSTASGQVDPNRTFTLTGMERHVYPYPARAIRTQHFLYLRNITPDRWPTGESKQRSPPIDFTKGDWPTFPGAFSFNIDPSPTKQYLLDHRTDTQIETYFDLACGRRPVDELYDLKKDPHQLRNVATDPEYAEQRHDLSRKLEHELQKSGDPRFAEKKDTEDTEDTEEVEEVEDDVTSDHAACRPNILFIAMDDLNDWTGCLGGHPQALTPNLDRLARSGMLFTNAHCSAPACNPSRTAIFTGRSPHQSGLYRNEQRMRDVLPDAEILPRTLSRHGYHSAGSGKLLHYFIDAASWCDYFPEAKTENPFPRTLYPETRPLSLPRGGPWQYIETDWGPLDATDEQYGGDYLVAKWISEQLAIERDKPFFLACGIYRPHEPWFVPQKYFEPFPIDSIELPPGYKEDDLDDLPPEGKRRGPNRYFAHIQKHGQWKQAIQAYLASIHFSDAMLGTVLDALEKSPHANNTIVVLWSDHGWHLGEKQHWQKFTAWRACTRVPLIVRVPKDAPGLPPGTVPSRCSKPVNLLSLFPTLLELCGLPAEPHHDGASLVPLLRNPRDKWPHVSVTHLAEPGSFGLSTERWRYLHYANGDEELYDIELDPFEWTNLADIPKHAAKLDELRMIAPKVFAPKPPARIDSHPVKSR